jgi:hypothetical protein
LSTADDRVRDVIQVTGIHFAIKYSASGRNISGKLKRKEKKGTVYPEFSFQI